MSGERSFTHSSDIAEITFTGGGADDTTDSDNDSSNFQNERGVEVALEATNQMTDKDHMRENLVKTERFNPFDRSGEFYRSSDDLFPQLKYGAEISLSEDHFALNESSVSITSAQELTDQIARYKAQVLESEPKSEKQRDLVVKLVQLRLKLAELKDIEDPKVVSAPAKSIMGHRFVTKDALGSSGPKKYCEHCNHMIWGILQTWYLCTECGFSAHDKCVNLIHRTCASTLIDDHPQYILFICPEKGLAAQNYKCAECRAVISYQSGFGEPRLCDYTGNYYCSLCHWNDQVVIPARVLRNWDLVPRKVCRASKQYLRLLSRRPVLRVQDINPMLFSFVEELNQVKKLREEILVMKRYFLSCKHALQSKLLLQLRHRQHFVENSDMYSLLDLIDTAHDVLLPQLARVHTSFAQHIKTDCQSCQGKGYVCELCADAEILFPFDNHAIVCAQCSTVLHRHCFVRRQHRCPKCERVLQRERQGQREM